MSERVFDRETLLDATVNFIPMGMIVFFTAMFLLMNPWEDSLIITVTAYMQLVIPFVSMAVITYLMMKYV